MKVRRFLIAGGNSTALIFECPEELRKETSCIYLREVEQVGFVKENRLTMMGGELCINATLAFASTLNNEGILYTAGIKTRYINYKDKTTIFIKPNYKIIGNIILFKGIGFICIKKQEENIVSKEFVSKLCEEYNFPAFGAIVYEENRITPYVYVKEVNSFVKETACGSGSIALGLFSGFKDIIQPTGEVISINVKKTIEISARVTLINNKNLNKTLKETKKEKN